MELHCLRSPALPMPRATLLRLPAAMAARPVRAMPMQRSLAVPVFRRAFNGQALQLRAPTVPPMGRGIRRLLPVSMAHSAVPAEQGLFNPANDRDACGVGFVGELSGVPTRKTVTDALSMLVRMAHRGACGCESDSGVFPCEVEVMSPLSPVAPLRRRRVLWAHQCVH